MQHKSGFYWARLKREVGEFFPACYCAEKDVVEFLGDVNYYEASEVTFGEMIPDNDTLKQKPYVYKLLSLFDPQFKRPELNPKVNELAGEGWRVHSITQSSHVLLEKVEVQEYECLLAWLARYCLKPEEGKLTWQLNVLREIISGTLKPSIALKLGS